MVDVLGKPALLTGQLSQAATTAECAELLQLVSQAPMAIAHVLDSAARMGFAIRIHGDSGNTQVDAEHAVNIDRFRFLNLSRGKQISIATNERRIAFTDTPGKQLALAFTTHKRDGVPALNCPDRNGGSFVRQNAIVKGNRTQWFESALCLAIQFVGVCDFGDTTHRELRRQTKRIFHVVVGQLVDAELPEHTGMPGNLAELIAGSIGRHKRVLEGVCLVRCRLQFQLERQPHTRKSVADTNVCVNGSSIRNGRRACRRSRIPLPPKVGSFLRGI